MKISLIFIGSRSAGPVYSLEMAKALCSSGKCSLQINISKSIDNLSKWTEAFANDPTVQLNLIDTYSHTTLGVLKTLFFDHAKKGHLINLVNNFNPDVVYFPFEFLWGDYVLKRLHCDRIIKTLHDPHPHDSFLKGFKWFVLRTLSNSYSMKYVSDIIVLNNRDVEYVKGTYKRDVVVIPHASFSYYVKERVTNYTLQNRIAFFGRIEPYKGLDILVEAFEKQKNSKLELIIAGGGTIEPSLYNIISRNHNIKLLNRFIEDSEIQELINSVDFVVLPYRRASQSGVIPLTFAFGKTVVATNVGALSEQVPNGTGILVTPDADKVSDAITYLYDNEELIEKYGRNAQRYAETELTWEHSANLLLSYISK